jgi:hypothetical protein
VAGCICLFSLDKHQAIPVDTHVWQFACRYYTPELTGKSVTPKMMAVVENAVIGIFGPYAGWAHNILFIAEVRGAIFPARHECGSLLFRCCASVWALSSSGWEGGLISWLATAKGYQSTCGRR